MGLNVDEPVTDPTVPPDIRELPRGPETAVAQPSNPTTPAQVEPATPPSVAVASGSRRTPLFEATNSARYFRQSLIRDIEAQTGNSLICHVAAQNAQIERHDTVAMVDLLHNVPVGSPIDVLLNSPGGDIDTAEKLVSLVRRRAGTSQVRVIVPDYAKSAATLIALGANQIVMSDSSELGAIDPQVTLVNGQGSLTYSASSYIDAYTEHAQALQDDPQDPVARLMLDKLDPVTLRKMQRTVKRSTAIAVDLLQQAMIKDETAAQHAATQLSNTERWHSHGQVIGHEVCRGLGLDIVYLPPQSDLWEDLWRLYCLQLWALNGGPIKLFESNIASLAL